jgi:hypothetical protein
MDATDLRFSLISKFVVEQGPQNHMKLSNFEARRHDLRTLTMT